MDVVRGAAPLARSLLALADPARDVTLQLRDRRGVRISVCVQRGTLCGIEGVAGEPLGDLLLRRGALNVRRHAAALRVRPGAPSGGRLGAWLVAVGAATAHDVRSALEAQMIQRLQALLRRSPYPWQRMEQRVAAQRQAYEVRIDLAAAVLRAMLELAGEAGLRRAPEKAGEPLRATHLGSRLLPRLSLAPRAIAAGDVLELPDLLRACPELLRLLGLANEWGEGATYSLLLRKQRELRRRVGPRALLDMPPAAGPEHARAALRRLAGKLHPDRFALAAPGLQAMSNEVMQALALAERSIRASPAPL